MSRIIDKLVNVSISISKSAASSDSFNKLLLVAVAPTIDSPPANYAEYGSIAEVVSAGFEENGAVYNAALVAFSNGASSIVIATKGTSETIANVLDRAFSSGSWYGFALIGFEKTEYKNAAAWAEANEKLFGFTTSDKENPLSEGTYYNTHGWYADSSSETGNAYNDYLHIAVMAKCFTYEAGEETWAYKSLSLVGYSMLTAAERGTLEGLNINYYVECANGQITYPGKTLAGEWIDVIRGKAWLQSDMQNRVYNLFIKNPKVPYTSKGIALIENQMIASLKQAQSNGLVAEDEYDSDDNLVAGFTVTVPTAANTTDTERASRNLNACKFTARLAGAIHAVEIKGTLVS